MAAIRRILVHVLMILMMLFGLSLVFIDNQVRADRASCDQIRTACKNAGFILGGRAGDALLLDCYDPIVQGTRQPRAASRALPAINPRFVAACRAGNDSAPAAPPASAPLVPAADGQTVYDPNLNITWLADANLAATQTFGVSGINKSGSMNYAAALRWVVAMNALDHGAGYLGHNNWQLPTAPSGDKGCARTGRNGESFGFHCSGSALGSLYYRSLALREPDTAVRIPTNKVGPFTDSKASLREPLQPLAPDSKSTPAAKRSTTRLRKSRGSRTPIWRPNKLSVLPVSIRMVQWITRPQSSGSRP